MPVQAVPINPPPTPEPSVIDSTANFIQNYWAVILLILAVGIAIYFFYYWRKERKREERTKYHKIVENLEELCRMQVNKNRLQSNPIIMFGITGVISIIVWFLSMMFFDMAGLFIGLLLGFTVFIISGVIYYIFSPFVKRDMVFIRYKENNVIHEKYVGDYAGEHYGSDSYLNLLVYKGRKNLISRNKMVIRIPQSVQAFYDLEKLDKDFEGDEKGKEKVLKEITEKYSSFINELVQFNDRTIVINHAKSLDRFKFLFYPVFVDEMNHVISKGVRYYKSLKEQTALEQLYDLTDESSKAQIKAIQINPRVQYKQATGDEVIDDVETDND